MRIAYEQKGLVPQGYTRLEYLESSGTQYIDTGYAFTSLNHTTTVRFKNITGGSETPYWVGGTHAGGTDRSGGFVRITNDATKVGCGIGGITAGSSPYRTDMPVATPKTMSLVSKDTKKFDWIVDGSYIYTDTSFTGTSVNGLNEYIFACNRENVARFFSNVTIYSYQLIDNGVLVRDFIPVKRNSDNELGMYDLVGKKFYTNAGTGTFTAGSVIEEVEYLKGLDGAYIDTGYKPNNTTKVVFDTIPVIVSSVLAFGVRIGSTTTYEMWTQGASNWRFRKGQQAHYCSSTSYLDNKRKVFELGDGMYINGENVGTWTGSETTFQATDNLWLYRSNGYSVSYGNGYTFYYFKIYDNNILVRDFIPVKVGTEYAMFDKVNGLVYRNAGTGSFTGGNVVRNYTPRLVYTADKRLVPNEYEQLEYLGSTGNKWIDTGFIPTMKTGIIAQVEYTGLTGGDHYICGCRDDSGNTRFWCGSAANTLRGAIGAFLSLPSVTIQTNKKYLFTFNYNGDKKIGLDNTFYELTNAVEFNPTRNMYLFAVNNMGGAAYHTVGKIYSCKIYDNTTLIRDFVPVRRKSDSVLGMYDTVNGVFYTNQGTGSFTGGSVVSNYQLRFIRTPVIPPAYTRVEYLESSGTQYIDTSFKVDDTCGFLLDYMALRINDDVKMGVKGAGDSRWCISNTNNPNISLSWNNIYAKSISSLNTKHIAKMNYLNDRKRLFDGTELDSITETLNEHAADYNVLLFAAYWGSTVVQFKTTSRIYNAQITKGNAIVRNFIPCIRNSDNVAGMYDTVSKQFFTNAGTGTFLTGNPIPND